MTDDQKLETIIAGFVDGVRLLVPKWYRTRRGVDVPSPAFHYQVEDDLLAENEDGTARYPFVAYRAPRGHAKSTLVSKTHNLWRALMSGCVDDIDEYILIASASFRQSHSWVRAIADNLRYNKTIEHLFGRVQKGRYWRYGDGDLEVKFATGRIIRLRAAGAGMEFRGDQAESARPTCITTDDITKDDESKTETGRRSRVEWMLATVIPALDADGRLINVGTPRPYEDDWNAGIIEKLARGEDMDVEEEEDVGAEWLLRTWRAIPDMKDPTFPVLWPERYSREYLLRRLKMFRVIGKEWLWWSEYQCQVVGEGTKAFPRSWYEPFRWDGNLVRHPAGPYLQVVNYGRVPVNTFVGVDSAFSKARGADRTAITCWGMSPERDWYQIEQVVERGMPSPEAITEAVLMGARNQARHVMFERVAAQQALAEFAREKMGELTAKGELDHFMDIRDHPPGTRQSKEERIKSGLQTPYSLGRVHHRKGLHREIEAELESFPAVHPDILDSEYYSFIEAYPANHAAPGELGRSPYDEERRVEIDFLTGKPVDDRSSTRQGAIRRVPGL